MLLPLPHELPQEEFMNLTLIGEACFKLLKDLNKHNFEVLKFHVVVSKDLAVHTRYVQVGIPTEIVVDHTLPAGTINVAALVQ